MEENSKKRGPITTGHFPTIKIQKTLRVIAEP